MERSYRVGTRTSPLALKQVEEILNILTKYYSKVELEIVGIDTFGDKDKATPISQIEGTDFFTREVDESLLKGEIDFTIHSAKDLPVNLRDGLTVALVTPTIDPYDVLVSKSDLKLDDLPQGARVETSSFRRKTQLKNYRDDFEINDIRGNIEERLDKLDKSNLDAIVIAAAGLLRLGLGDRITERIPFGILKPHPLQGSLAIETQENNKEIIDLFKVVKKE
jgi:hydroxymethylbilane synthase